MKGKDVFIGQFYKNKALGGYNQATFVLTNPDVYLT